MKIAGGSFRDTRQRSSQDSAIVDRARHYADALRDDAADAGVAAEAERWLAADPRHRRAFEQINAVVEAVQGLADTPEILALRRAARERIERRRGPGHWRSRAIAAGLALVLAGATLLSMPDRQRDQPVPRVTYSTPIGVSKTVELADGSRIELNTDTELTVTLSPARRQIALRSGQAIFHVAHDAARPFVVSSAAGDVTALGTVFDVRLTGDLYAVTLVEGRVEVAMADRNRAAAGRRWQLTPGQRLIGGGGAEPAIETVAVDVATSWQDGIAVFDNTTLAAAVAEMNRYTRQKIVLVDPALAALPISGAFKTGSNEDFVAALAAYYPIAVRRSEGGDFQLAYRG